MQRWLMALGAVVGLGLPGGRAVARDVTPGQAPASWVAYATASTRTITAWLNGEDAPAPTVRAALDATRPAPDQPSPPVVVKLWIDGQGLIVRAEFTALADAVADADLHALLIGRQLTAPPRQMLQPLRIGLQLPPPLKPDPAIAAPSPVEQAG